MVNKRKKYNARFAPARIKKIMQKDEEIGKVAAAVPVIISRALELFVESLVKKAEGVTRSRNAKTLTPAHLKASILTDPRLFFLRETVSTVPDVIQDEDGESSNSVPNIPQPLAPPSPMNPGGGQPQRERLASHPPGLEHSPHDYHSSLANGSNPYAGYYGMPNMPYGGMPPSPYGIPNAHSGSSSPSLVSPPPPSMHNPGISPYAPYLPPSHPGQYPPLNYAPNSNSAFSHFGGGYPITPAVPCQGDEEDYDT